MVLNRLEVDTALAKQYRRSWGRGVSIPDPAPPYLGDHWVLRHSRPRPTGMRQEHRRLLRAASASRGCPRTRPASFLGPSLARRSTRLPVGQTAAATTCCRGRPRALVDPTGPFPLDPQFAPFVCGPISEPFDVRRHGGNPPHGQLHCWPYGPGGEVARHRESLDGQELRNLRPRQSNAATTQRSFCVSASRTA